MCWGQPGRVGPVRTCWVPVWVFWVGFWPFTFGNSVGYFVGCWDAKEGLLVQKQVEGAMNPEAKVAKVVS